MQKSPCIIKNHHYIRLIDKNLLVQKKVKKMKKNIAMMMICSSLVSVYAQYAAFDLQESVLDEKAALKNGQVVRMSDDLSSSSLDFVAIGDTDGRKIIHSDKNELVKEASIAAAAAYNDSEIVGLYSGATRLQKGNPYKEQIAQTQEIVTFSSDSRKGPPAGFVSYKEDATGKAQLTISFAGTEDFKDLRTDGNALWGNPSSLGMKGKIHSGFLNRYKDNRSSMLDVLQMVLDAHNKSIEDVSLLFTGHSLGGALATIAATDIKQNFAQNVRDINLVTFSSPRVGNQDFANYATNLLRETRIATLHRKGDPVPGIAFGAHVGQVVEVPRFASGTTIDNHEMALYVNDLHSPNKIDCEIGAQAPGTFSTVVKATSSAAGDYISKAGRGLKSAVSSLNPWNWGASKK